MSTQDPRHSDNVARGDAPSTGTVSDPSRAPARAVDNAARAAAAERERTFTGGGDDVPPTPPATTTAPAAPSLVTAATARIRADVRPSPFGVGQFPPLPLPPGLAK